MAYMDPAFFTTGKLVPANDLPGMGLTWLQMVTGITNPIGLHKKVEGALEAGQLVAVVASQAADWPLEVHRSLSMSEWSAAAVCPAV